MSKYLQVREADGKSPYTHEQKIPDDCTIYLDGVRIYPAPVEAVAKYVYDGDAITSNPKSQE